MSELTSSEKLLQDCVDELFALHEQTTEAHKKFVLESSALIKAGHQQVNKAHVASINAEFQVKESRKLLEQANQAAASHQRSATFWKRVSVWTGLGFFSFGVVIALTLWMMGKRYSQLEADLYVMSNATHPNHRHHDE